jgi:SP family facilitated glucose transporter-like MFS transporter 3
MNASAGILASLFILCHVAAFQMGAGPIPFILIGELVPSYVRAPSLEYRDETLIRSRKAAGAAGSLALGVCWAANFCVGLGFLPLQNALSRGSRDGQGNVFYVFACITLVLLLVLARAYRV